MHTMGFNRTRRPLCFKRQAIGLSLVCSVLTGCAQYPVAGESWAASVRQARTLQALHPQGMGPSASPVAGDGVVAQHAVERMHKSFETPPPPVNVLNIGVGTGTRGMTAR